MFYDNFTIVLLLFLYKKVLVQLILVCVIDAGCNSAEM